MKNQKEKRFSLWPFIPVVLLILIVLCLDQSLSFSQQNPPDYYYFGTTNNMAEEETSSSSSPPPSSSAAAAAAAAVELARMLGRLKTTPRTGWVRRGVPRYESVADHSWRVAALSLLLLGWPSSSSSSSSSPSASSDHDDFAVNVQKCISMAVLHDVAECLIGDIAPDDNVSKQEKQQMEQAAVNDIARLLTQATTTTTAAATTVAGDDNDDNNNTETKKRASRQTAGSYFLSLLHEYEERKSKEAIAVKDLDLLDMIIQADEYERVFDLDLSDFFVSTPVSRFRNPNVTEIAREIHRQRQERVIVAMAASKADGEKNRSDGLSKSDLAFVAEFSKASNLDTDSIESVIKALRHWDLR